MAGSASVLRVMQRLGDGRGHHAPAGRLLLAGWTIAVLVAVTSTSVDAATPSPTPTPTPATPTPVSVIAPLPSPVPAPPTPPGADPLAQQLAEQLARQAALAPTMAALAAKVAAAQGQHSALSSLILASQQAIDHTLADLAGAEQRYRDADARAVKEHAAATRARQQEREDKAQLAGYVRERYTSQDDLVAYVLAGDSVAEMFGRAADVSHLVDRGEALVVKVHQDVRDAETAEAAARKDSGAARIAAAQLSSQELQLESQTTQAQSLISTLNVQEQAAAHEIGLANLQSVAVAQQIAATRIAQLDATISAAEQAVWDAANYWIQQHPGSLPGGFGGPTTAPVAGHLIWPAPGTCLVQPFGPSPYAFEPAFGGYPHFHTGLDLTRGAGAPILAAASGVVVSADFGNDGYGNHIIIAHEGGLLTLYAHLAGMLVKPGDIVAAGQLIGAMGSTGNSTGPHLHFEVRFQGMPIDPLPLLPPLPPGACGPA